MCRCAGVLLVAVASELLGLDLAELLGRGLDHVAGGRGMMIAIRGYPAGDVWTLAHSGWGGRVPG